MDRAGLAVLQRDHADHRRLTVDLTPTTPAGKFFTIFYLLPGIGIILAFVDAVAKNAMRRREYERSLQMVEQAEANADVEVEEAVGDCAYGDGGTRRTFAEAGRKLVAKMAGRRTGTQLPKEDFRLDLEAMSCVCPTGQRTRDVVSISSGKRYGAPGVPLRAFRFDAAVCDVCPLRSSCMRARFGKGRLVMIHPQEALLQEARAFQQSARRSLRTASCVRRPSTGWRG